MDIKKLPIGEATFENLIQENNLYIDKTNDIYRLITEGKRYFLSRPRRFGKSLLVSTLDSIFSGRKDLFSGLAISRTDYDWKEHPVLRFDFSGFQIENPEKLEKKLSSQVVRNADRYGILLKGEDSSDKLEELLETLSKKRGKSIILVDEYDKPILENLTEPEQAKKIIDKLKGFYETMKKSDKHLRFRFVTGVSKFSHTSLFSGANDLKDITMHDRFSHMLGYTQEELEKYFDEHINELAKIQKKSRKKIMNDIMDWYNGYKFSEGGERVYNPFSTLLLFDQQKFSNYWFKTGTPTFLLDMLINQGYGTNDIDGIEIDEDTLSSSYDFRNIELEGLLYETGYLTIKEYDDNKKLYTLGYPNREVKTSLVKRLLNTISHQRSSELLRYTREITSGFKNNDLDNVFDRVNTILSGIPHNLFTKYEGHYHSLIGLMFEYAGLNPHLEKRGRKGDSDMILETRDNVYVLEFKTKENKGIKGAFDQIKDREYARKYEIGTKIINHVAVELDTEKREVKYEMKSTLSGFLPAQE